MNTINKDTLYSISLFLDNKTMHNISLVNKYNNKIINNNQYVYFRNKIIDIWGEKICKNLIPKKDMKKFLIYNKDTFIKILDIFYKKMICKKERRLINTFLFMEIYDHVYYFTNINVYNRKIFFYHRGNSIRQLYNNSEIDYNDEFVNHIINTTKYLDRFCTFIENHIFTSEAISNKTIIKYINDNINL